jgi:predicted transcriptional regulator
MSGEEERIERAVLGLLLSGESDRPWSVEELVREVGGSRLDVLDALERLRGVGLVHLNEEFVFATRAAWHFDRLGL